MWRRHYDVELDQLDLPVDPVVWQREQDIRLSPQARAMCCFKAFILDLILIAHTTGHGAIRVPTSSSARR